MKLKIVIYYDKDFKNLDDYTIKRLIIKDNDIYTLKSYFMINGKIEEYLNKFKMDEKSFNKYLKHCKKSKFYDKTVYEFITEGHYKYR